MSYTIRKATPQDTDVVVDFNARLALESEGKTLDLAKLLPGVRAQLADEHKGVYHLALDATGAPVGKKGGMGFGKITSAEMPSASRSRTRRSESQLRFPRSPRRSVNMIS